MVPSKYAVVLVALVLLAGCKEGTELTGPFGAVKGVVVDADTSAPLADIAVSLTVGTDTYAGRTGSDGAFEMVCKQGSVTIALSSPYYDVYTDTVNNNDAENDLGTIALQARASTMVTTLEDVFIMRYADHYSTTDVRTYTSAYGVVKGTIGTVVEGSFLCPDGFVLEGQQPVRNISAYFYVYDNSRAQFTRNDYGDIGSYTVSLVNSSNDVVHLTDSVDGIIGYGTLSSPTPYPSPSVATDLAVSWSFPSTEHIASIVVILTSSSYNQSGVAFCESYPATTTQTTVPAGKMVASTNYQLYIVAVDRAVTTAQAVAAGSYYPYGLVESLDTSLDLDIDSVSYIWTYVKAAP